MSNELVASFKEFQDKLPTQFDEGGFVFSSKVLPQLGSLLEVSQPIVKKTYHDYESYYRADCLTFCANKDIYKYLGLAILSLLFHGNKRITLLAKNKESDIKNLIIEYDNESNPRDVPNFITKPFSFEYYPQAVDKHPWIHHQNLNPVALPLFLLTNEKQSIIRAEEWQQRDTLLITGSDEALVRLAELFLNISNPKQEQTEFVLESEVGFRGVGPGSAEVVLALPGSVKWDQRKSL